MAQQQPSHSARACMCPAVRYSYFHAKAFAKNISDAPDSTFQDGMITDAALERLRPLAADSAKPFFLAVGLHKRAWNTRQLLLQLSRMSCSGLV